MDEITQIEQNLAEVKAKIDRAISSSGRAAGCVKLVVVTKRKSIAVVQELVRLGITEFGENYPEEALEKITSFEVVPGNIHWHMIGSVQSRKVNILADHFSMIHSIDRYSVAVKLNESMKTVGKVMPVLLQFNVSGEQSKSGWAAWESKTWAALSRELKQFCTLEYVRVLGLMTIPPFSETAENSRPYYQKLKQLQEYLQFQVPELSWNEFSIGTSFDFEVAIQEGATLIRVGEAILGKRS